MRVLKVLGGMVAAAVLLAMVGAAGVAYGLWKYGRGLPEYHQLADYEPPVMTRVHAGDGRLIAEYAREHRLFVPVDAIPRRVIAAFLSAEDKNFYRHPGIDVLGIARAVFTNLRNLGSSRRPVGASTITQQVAKNFLLSGEVSIERKVKEAILAFRIERAFTKDRILELYINEIYLGVGSYGAAAAALNYFDKSLDELNLAEAAYLAALPKAPNNYHPVRNAARAKGRRDWVIGRMLEDGAINAEEATLAIAKPLGVRRRGDTEFVKADWFTEEVRRELVKRYGEDRLYEGGMSVRTSMEPRLQAIGERMLRDGLMTYDRRHGYRGPIGRLDPAADWRARLTGFKRPNDLLAEWQTAIVLRLDRKAAEIGFADDRRGTIALDDVTWARRVGDNGKRGSKIKQIGDVFSIGDVIAVARLDDDGADDDGPDNETDANEAADDETDDDDAAWSLRQVPAVQGAVVAIDPHTGRVLALIGGWSYRGSQFNRATQAERQPGSAFKPFVYAAALDHGFTPSSLVLDAPFVIDQGPGLGKWKPANYTRKFYGPSTLRLGIEKSRNLMTVRLAQTVGMETIAEYARRFGLAENMPEQLSMALGAAETTLLNLTTAYAMLVNGGRRITPTIIDRVQDRRGSTVFRHDRRECPGCIAVSWHDQRAPEVVDDRAQVIDPVTAYQLVSILQGVVLRGTGVRIRAVGKPLGGKTGTTNQSRDAWFIGFSPDMAVGVYVGFDTPKSLGRRETGSSVAVPIFRDFMAAALADQPGIPFRIPSGVRLVRIDAATGTLAGPGRRGVILEAFRPGTEPSGERQVLDSPGSYRTGVAGADGSQSGLY